MGDGYLFIILLALTVATADDPVVHVTVPVAIWAPF